MTNALLAGFGAINMLMVLVLVRQWPQLDKGGRVGFTGLILVFFPGMWTLAVALASMEGMKSISFCESCHVMEPYVAGLKLPGSEAIAARHYQNNWLPQDTSCYSCHTSYSMFGNVEAKINGLKHVWVNYVTGPPEELTLYKPYANEDCLHCHGPALSFRQEESHEDMEDSCMDCHEAGHLNPEVTP